MAGADRGTARPLSGGGGGEGPLGNGSKPTSFNSQERECSYALMHGQLPGSQSQCQTLRSGVNIGGPTSLLAPSSRR